MKIDIGIDILGQLMPNLLTVLSQFLATGVLFFLMVKLAYKPLKNIMDTRAAYEQEKLTKAEALLKENEEVADNARSTVEKAKQQAAEIIGKAVADGEQMKEKLIREGKEKADNAMRDAMDTIENQKSKMLDEMHDEMVDIAFTAAEKMVESKLDETSDRQKISDFIKDIKNK